MDERFYDELPGELPYMGMLEPDPKGVSIGVVKGVDEDAGRVSGVYLDYGLGEFTNVPIVFPAVGADWCIAAMPSEGDMVEIFWTTQSDAWARPVIPFRYYDWAKVSLGNKKIKKGELFLRSKGGAYLSLNPMGQVLMKDSTGESIFLDPVQSLGQYQAQFTEIHQAGSSALTLGTVKRFQTTTSGVQLKDIDLPAVPGILPPNEFHLRVVPGQLSLSTNDPLKLVDLKLGDVYDSAGSKITEGGKTPLSLLEVKALGFTLAKEFQFDDGSFQKTYNLPLPVPVQQLQEVYDSTSGVYSLKQAVLAALVEVLQADPSGGLTIPLTLALRKLIDERLLNAFNNHVHPIDGNAALLLVTAGLAAIASGGTPNPALGAVSGGPAVSPGSSVLAIVPPIPASLPATVSPLVLTTGNDPLSLIPLPAVPLLPFYYPVSTSVVQAA